MLYKVIKQIPYLHPREFPRVSTVFRKEEFTDGGLVLKTLINGGFIEQVHGHNCLITNIITMKEIIEKIEALNVEFPVRESDEFDEGRRSMKREVLEIICNAESNPLTPNTKE